MITSIEMAKIIKEYAKDPNCYAGLWISDSEFDHMMKQEKEAFVAVGNIIKMRFDLTKKKAPVS